MGLRGLIGLAGFKRLFGLAGLFILRGLAGFTGLLMFIGFIGLLIFIGLKGLAGFDRLVRQRLSENVLAGRRLLCFSAGTEFTRPIGRSRRRAISRNNKKTTTTRIVSVAALNDMVTSYEPVAKARK